MAQIQIPEEFAAHLQQLALEQDRPLEEIVGEAISTYLSDRASDTTVTPLQLEHLKHSLAQANQSDLVPQHEVEAFFDSWEKEIASR